MAIHRHPAGEIIDTAMAAFEQDVLNGLGSNPKFLPSKYFYDAEGDKLFQQIMACPEYYLTRCELEIFSQQTRALAQTVLDRHSAFDIVELGPGDATKSVYLLQHLKRQGRNFKYYPVDISKNTIHALEKTMPQNIPGMEVIGLNGEYLEMMKVANQLSQKTKLILFLGSNIGNFTPEVAVWFLKSLHKELRPGDLLLTGVDLKKNPKQILVAYNDKEGITRAFNLNLLKRINRELQADFDLSAFDHYPTYNPVTGACRSYLVSMKKQAVRIGGRTISFFPFEPVYVELSQKYSVAEMDAMARQAGFNPLAYFYDSQAWFLNALWEKQND
jgi:dimethylhistidine N-methyltransferase